MNADPVHERMREIRRDLHRHPELSWEESRTQTVIQAELDRLGIPWKAVRTGVVATMAGPDGVPAVALRADMDALPVHEETGLPFSSETPGVMHACGHDGHTSMVLGAAAILKGKDLPAPVRLLFQPAEERGEGARALIEGGALDGVGMIFGGHVDRHYETGTLVITEGPVNASTDEFVVEIEGQDGHGARPHESVDAIVVGSLMVMALQTIVSREVDPARPSVVSVGTFQAGSAPNVIAGRARLSGTIRAQHPQVRAQLAASITRIAKSVGQLHGAGVEVRIIEGTPPVVNPPDAAFLAKQAAGLVVPSDRILPLRVANMGGEDFAYFQQKVPGCYIRFGATPPGKTGFPAHSSRFDFDEDALSIGAAWLAQVALIAGKDLADKALRSGGNANP